MAKISESRSWSPLVFFVRFRRIYVLKNNQSNNISIECHTFTSLDQGNQIKLY